MTITKENLPARNFGTTRPLTAIDTIVIHHTGGGIGGLLPTLRDRGLSYHYAIQPNGDIIQFTKPQTTAFHARHLILFPVKYTEKTCVWLGRLGANFFS